MRHTGAGLAIPDFPTAFGGLWPSAEELQRRGVGVHFAHRLGAVVVLVLVLSAVRALARLSALNPVFGGFAAAWAGLVVGPDPARRPFHLVGKGAGPHGRPPRRGRPLLGHGRPRRGLCRRLPESFERGKLRRRRMSLSRIPSTFASYVALTKPRITVFVVMTAFVGFVAGTNGPLSSLALPLLLHTLFGTALVASGTSAFNQVCEMDLDGLMRRTQDRPLPSGRIGVRGAALFAGALSVVGLAELFLFTNVLTTALAAFTLVSYVGLYTPMKTRSPASTIVGAVPGALPPLGGYTAATGALGLPGLALFAILFVWQLPHFFAIGWRHRADYARAGVRILPVDRPIRQAHRPADPSLDRRPPPDQPPALARGDGRLRLRARGVRHDAPLPPSSLRFARETTDGRARSLFLASIGWLPAILVLLVLDRV